MVFHRQCKSWGNVSPVFSKFDKLVYTFPLVSVVDSLWNFEPERRAVRYPQRIQLFHKFSTRDVDVKRVIL